MKNNKEAQKTTNTVNTRNNIVDEPKPNIVNATNMVENTSFVSGLRQFIMRNAPHDISTKYERARPFLFLSFAAWPVYWLYKGVYWSRVRGTERLGTFINKTYHEAKFMQLAVILSSILALTYAPRNENVVQLLKHKKRT